MTDTPTTPMIVNSSPTKDQIGSIARDILLVAAALPTLVAVLGTHDLGKIVAYIESQQFYPVLGVLVTGGVVVWRQIITRTRKAELVTAAKSADDSVAVVK
jgi:hypothetical protein